MANITKLLYTIPMGKKILSKHTGRSHKIDADQLVDTIERLVRQKNERMTTVRRDVALALASFEEPHTAYQILAAMNKKRSPKLSAMSLYRTLDFLTKLGVVIRYESQNSYRLCLHSIEAHSHLMMICDGCGKTLEIEDEAAAQRLQKLALKHGHWLKHHVIELHGFCSKCH